MRKLTLRPGVNTQLSPTLNEAGISDSQLIRFPFGLPEKQGGWQGYPNLDPIIGTCRGLFGWSDFNGNTYMACGTEQRLQVVDGGVMTDITPTRTMHNDVPAYSTTSGSSVVTVHDVLHGAIVGDWVDIITAVSVGGLILQGLYQIQTIIDTDNYTIDAGALATATVSLGGMVSIASTTNGSSTVSINLDNHGQSVGEPFTIRIATTVGGIPLQGTYSVLAVIDADNFTFIAGSVATSTASAPVNGGDARMRYLLQVGGTLPTFTTGFGVGDWGAGDWGVGQEGSRYVPARQWSLFNFGQDLIASPTNGAIYFWEPPNPTPAQVVDPSAPLYNNVVFGMGQTQIIIAAGAEAGGTQFPTLIRWCDEGDFTDWVATTGNAAGSFQLPTGSTVVSGLAIGLAALLWTDVDMWSMQFIGLPLVFSFNRVGIACQPLSVKAVAVMPGNVIAWPGPKGFFRYDGGTVAPLDCTVWDTFFDLLDKALQTLVFSAVNALFSEVSWYYTRLDGQTGYVRWNFANNKWDQGVLERTAWCDLSPFGNPVGSDYEGRLFQHEIGTDADLVPLAWSFTTGYFDLQDGEDFTFVDMLIPDFVGDYSTVNVTILVQDAPNLTVRTYGPYAMTPGMEYLNVSVRGRQMALKFSGNDLGSHVRLGGVRYRFATAGRR